jgi:hypothetical protein
MALDPVRVNRNGKIACTATAKLPAIMRKPNPEACRRWTPRLSPTVVRVLAENFLGNPNYLPARVSRVRPPDTVSVPPSLLKSYGRRKRSSKAESLFAAVPSSARTDFR